jgi:hypothetical protein
MLLSRGVELFAAAVLNMKSSSSYRSQVSITCRVMRWCRCDAVERTNQHPVSNGFVFILSVHFGNSSVVAYVTHVMFCAMYGSSVFEEM